MGPHSRVVVLVDMDCFYCQVEEKLNPSLKGKPIAVVQYNTWKGGGIIAVNYPARDEGVTRHMRGDDAKRKCPSLNLVQVPVLRGKADLTKYRDAGKSVADVLATFTPLLQRASVDEAYLDITELVERRIEASLDDLCVDNLSNTYVVGCDLKDFLENVIADKEFSSDDLKLAVGGLVTEEIRREVLIKTGYKCSAGIAHNKTLAKLVCSLHKPNKQTILLQSAVPKFFESMPIDKVKNLGGKFGQTLSRDFQITYMGQLANISEKDLAKQYDEKTAKWLSNIARGLDMEPVATKLISKSIACCKNFTGPSALMSFEDVERWLNMLSAEMSERLNKDLKENSRKAKQIVVSFSQELDNKEVSSSRTHPLTSYEAGKIARDALIVIKKFCQRSDGNCHVKFLGLSAGHFEDITKLREITSYFRKGQKGNEETLKINDSRVSVNDNFFSFEEKEENIYCQTTQELHENPEELIFYDDSHRLKNNNDSIRNDTNDCTSQYENCVSRKDSDIEKTANVNMANIRLPSFFSKYFDASPESKYKSQKSPNRFIEGGNNDERGNNVLQEVHMAEEEPSEICCQCHKRIPISDFLSHQDYHFAVEIAKSEKNVPPKLEVKERINSLVKRQRGKSVKRKIESTNTLEAFLKKDDKNSDETETCVECCKKIRIEELNSHMDYHAAKKIHQEINGIKPSIISKVNCTKSKVTKNKNQTPSRSVKSFFQTK